MRYLNLTNNFLQYFTPLLMYHTRTKMLCKYIRMYSVELPYFRNQFPRKLFFFEFGLIYWSQYIKARKLFNGENYSRAESIRKIRYIHLFMVDSKNKFLSIFHLQDSFLTLLGLGLIKINEVSANFNNPRPSLILNN